MPAQISTPTKSPKFFRLRKITVSKKVSSTEDIYSTTDNEDYKLIERPVSCEKVECDLFAPESNSKLLHRTHSHDGRRNEKSSVENLTRKSTFPEKVARKLSFDSFCRKSSPNVSRNSSTENLNHSASSEKLNLSSSSTPKFMRRKKTRKVFPHDTTSSKEVETESILKTAEDKQFVGACERKLFSTTPRRKKQLYRHFSGRKLSRNFSELRETFADDDEYYKKRSVKLKQQRESSVW